MGLFLIESRVLYNRLGNDGTLINFYFCIQGSIYFVFAQNGFLANWNGKLLCTFMSCSPAVVVYICGKRSKMQMMVLSFKELWHHAIRKKWLTICSTLCLDILLPTPVPVPKTYEKILPRNIANRWLCSICGLINTILWELKQYFVYQCKEMNNIL